MNKALWESRKTGLLQEAGEYDGHEVASPSGAYPGEAWDCP
ncbi:hypothetical protein [Paraflavitalea speifideaquila]|nr:hypothetical protein [Paraflavitalea speifideiaquila]